MPAFTTAGQVHVTVDPFINVDPLPSGTYRFRLEVMDAAGNLSAPAEVTVTVAQPQPQPTPTPFPRTSPIGRIPIQPVVEEAEKISRIPIFKRPMGF
jgi:hypothetical protein